MDETLLKLGVAMLSVTNPIGGAIIFVTLTSKCNITTQRKIAAKVAFVIMVTLIITCWFGRKLLHILEVKICSFQIIGGIIMFIIGMSMVHGQHASLLSKNRKTTENKDKVNTSNESIDIVPLAITVIAGPDAMATLIVGLNHFHSLVDKIEVTIMLVCISIIIGIALYFSRYITKILGILGIKIITSIMGILLASIAIEMLTVGLKLAFPGLG